MSVSSIFPTTSGATNPSDPTQAVPAPQTLGQDDFLKLLVTQMSSQDPLNPQKDTDFIAQMAQFSSLEQAKTMGGVMASMQADALMGRTVVVNGTDDTQTVGVVSGVQIQAGTPQIIVNGQTYDMSQLAGILPTPTTAAN